MQKHINAVGSKLLRHQKWYIIHVWRHQMTSLAWMTKLQCEITVKDQNVHCNFKW